VGGQGPCSHAQIIRSADDLSARSHRFKTTGISSRSVAQMRSKAWVKKLSQQEVIAPTNVVVC
ncbi:hypothetical protein, partial [Xanthomonas arboricola]|uniref:hypothetical protein n=1 Tax=Xanthomonas arboricola TaxID=56448 RepID=UPI004040C9D5